MGQIYRTFISIRIWFKILNMKNIKSNYKITVLVLVMILGFGCSSNKENSKEEKKEVADESKPVR